ncbi:MAG TPA: hypothetical protein VF461_00645 [Gemmatimonadaceae bacterium]
MTISAMLLALCAATARGQGPSTIAPASDSACSYRQCALGIAPAWNGLAVVRGTGGPRVANLHFFWPADISTALRGDPFARGADSAAASARRAISLRRAGAALTDLGVVATGIAVVTGMRARRIRTEERAVGGAGFAAILLSVPLQFAADGALSRAVWWHNMRYTH